MSNRNHHPKPGGTPVNPESNQQAVDSREILFKYVVTKAFPTATGFETLRFTRSDTGSGPLGIPIRLQRYDFVDLATGRTYWFMAGRSASDVWLQIDDAGLIIHFE